MTLSHLEALQVEPSFQQIPITVMQNWVNTKRNANYQVKIAEIYGTALYDTGTNISCMSYIHLMQS